MSVDWNAVAKSLLCIAEDAAVPLDEGQRTSVKWMAKRLPESGLILADEVGTGKTRIACAVVHAVLEAGGRAAVVVPHGLMHQWQHEANVLGMSRGKEFTSLRNFIETAEPSDCETIAPAPDKSEWLLVSHGFRSPQVRQGNNPAEWRVALPSHVRAAMTADHIRNNGRTHAGRLLTNCHERTWKIAQAINAQVHGQPSRNALRARLDRLPWFNRGGNNTELINVLQGEEGRQLVEHLLGLWLGEFDLVVIDEAHKSRGDADVEGAVSGAVSSSVLSRLVDKLLIQPGETGRRLCLTATPMELEMSQWLDLLKRAHCGIDPKRGKKVIMDLHDAAGRAAIAPDEGERLDNLCVAAEEFEKALKDYVTRRRRDEDPLITTFRLRAGRPDYVPHPHRRLQRVQIGWTDTVGQNSPWLDVLFAAECMSQSARGLTLKDTENWPRAVRDAYTKLSAGHVSIDLLETDEPLRVPEPGVIDDQTRGKIVRTAYWYRRLSDGRRRVLEGLPPVNGAELDPDAEHPRIIAAVKQIESWTLKREKVLVFGVFLQPLRLLRDVLNVRHALRAADAGRPIAHAVHTDAALLGIALLQLDRLRAEGALSSRLAKGNGTDMRRALADSHRAYKRLRNKVRRRAKKPVVTWGTDASLLGGVQADRELKGALEDHLVSFVLDDFLAATSESDEVTDNRFEALTAEFVEERLRPLLGELGSENADEEQALLRHKTLRTLTEDDDGRQSFHARLLQGATRWETRRYLQAAFNRPGASPWVLIAQSQVGREGLNLHESCRVVVQFHAEWNPAVLEQQIGRVDRKGSLWEQRAHKWLADGTPDEPPFVEVRQLIFEGTYDAFQWERVMRRQHIFDASLFGSLLPADAWERVPDGRKIELLEAAPSFSPVREP